MATKIEDRAPMLVVGVEVRTNNELEMSGKGKLSALWKRVRSEPVFEHVQHVAEPGTTLAVYSDYANREKGDYSFLIGEQVTRIEDPLPPGMASRSIPAARVAVLHSAKGPLPDIMIELWKRIWGMSPSELGGNRAFTFDVERYDERTRDLKNAQVEVTIAID